MILPSKMTSKNKFTVILDLQIEINCVIKNYCARTDVSILSGLVSLETPSLFY